jgi:hypothetical protein
MSFRSADEGLTDCLLPLGDLFLDRRDVDVVLGEFLVDLLELGAVAFAPCPPERQGNLSAFANQGFYLRRAGGNDSRALTRRWTYMAPWNWRAAFAHDLSPRAGTMTCRDVDTAAREGDQPIMRAAQR